MLLVVSFPRRFFSLVCVKGDEMREREREDVLTCGYRQVLPPAWESTSALAAGRRRTVPISWRITPRRLRMRTGSLASFRSTMLHDTLGWLVVSDAFHMLLDGGPPVFLHQSMEGKNGKTGCCVL